MIASISKWVEQRKLRGFYFFSYEDVRGAYPSKQESYITTSLTRLVSNKTLINPAKGFYVIIPTEYSLSGVVPAVFYIDSMMKHLKRNYYVGLLNAASFYGAAHQRPQSFCVINDNDSIRSGERSGLNYKFIRTKQILEDYIVSYKGKLGNIRVSSPELTALDLVAYQAKVGGLTRVCSVLSELVESLDFSKVNSDFFIIQGLPVYQRLGYILEEVLEETNISDSLYSKMKEYNILRFRKTPFKIGKPIAGCDLNQKWKVYINQKIEIDL